MIYFLISYVIKKWVITLNSYVKTIDNCLDCEFHYVERIITADSFEHDDGVYCSQCSNKLVVADDWNLRRWSKIPDWCPMLSRNRKTDSPHRKIMYHKDRDSIICSVLNTDKCECGCNVVHLEYDEKVNAIFGICNACKKEVYIVESEDAKEMLMSKGTWK